MEPLLPDLNRPELAELVQEILLKSGALASQMPARVNREKIAALVREMNSYYSNLIEGHRTRPRDIEKAMRQEYEGDPVVRANQHLARAHIETERAMVARLSDDPDVVIHSREFLSWLHREFYARLPEDLQFSESRSGRRFRIEPGTLRTFEVEVHRHQPPAASSLPAFLDRFESVYASRSILATSQLVALAAAHHRLAWIHPFGDGNGRVARLYSHAWLWRCGVHGQGLWTLSRGLARQRQDYYVHLAGADQQRRGDMDGRGNLTEKGLAAFCKFMLEVMLDQVEFMQGVLDLRALGARMEKYLEYERLHLPPRERGRLAKLLKASLAEGEIERGRVPEILGVGASTAQKVIRLALAEGLMASPSPKGVLSLTFGADTLEAYFPRLYQDLPILN